MAWTAVPEQIWCCGAWKNQLRILKHRFTVIPPSTGDIKAVAKYSHQQFPFYLPPKEFKSNKGQTQNSKVGRGAKGDSEVSDLKSGSLALLEGYQKVAGRRVDKGGGGMEGRTGREGQWNLSSALQCPKARVAPPSTHTPHNQNTTSHSPDHNLNSLPGRGNFAVMQPSPIMGGN